MLHAEIKIVNIIPVITLSAFLQQIAFKSTTSEKTDSPIFSLE